MRRSQTGFGLLEVLLAMAVGLLLLTAASQAFASAYHTWRLQGAALQLQGDARLALTLMAQDIRMTGMFGCLRLQPTDFLSASAASAFTQPLQVSRSHLRMIVAELPGHAGAPDWTLLTDCQDSAQVKDGRHAGTAKTQAIALSRMEYRLSEGRLMRLRGKSSQPLLDHVRTLRFLLVGERIDVWLELYEPTFKLVQRHSVSVALRNPLSDS